jgi:ribonuclease HI
MSLSVLKEQRPTIRIKKIQSISKYLVEKCIAGWFDGAACATGLNNGTGGVIQINENKIFKWVFNCGLGTNTRAELLGAWALIALIVWLDISDFYVQGDSRIIIDWLIGKGKLQVISLECWKDRISELKNHFRLISFKHVYCEENYDADNLSKKALLRPPGKIEYFQCVEDHEGPHMLLDIFYPVRLSTMSLLFFF